MNKVDKILITGGAGFIGSTMANHLGDHNDIVVIDDLSMGNRENLDQTKKSLLLKVMSVISKKWKRFCNLTSLTISFI